MKPMKLRDAQVLCVVGLACGWASLLVAMGQDTKLQHRHHPPAPLLSTDTCGSTTIALNSEEPTCNSHNGRWIGVSETGGGDPIYWTATPLAHSTFVYYGGIVSLPDPGTYLITTEIPVASDCGVTVTAKLKINSTIVETRVSPGGNRILRHRFIYEKGDSETDEIKVTVESAGGYGFAQGAVLDIQRTDVGL